MKNQINLGFSEYLLRPELFLASRLHLALTPWTGMFIPQSDVITAALQTQTANLTSIGRCHVGNDATYHDVLDGLAVRTRHSRNLLTKESASFVHLGLVAALSAAIFQFPSHTPKCIVSFRRRRYEKNPSPPNDAPDFCFHLPSSIFLLTSSLFHLNYIAGARRNAKSGRTVHIEPLQDTG